MADEGLVRDLAIASAIVLVVFSLASYLVKVEEAAGMFTTLAVLGGLGTVVFGAWAVSMAR